MFIQGRKAEPARTTAFSCMYHFYFGSREGCTNEKLAHRGQAKSGQMAGLSKALLARPWQDILVRILRAQKLLWPEVNVKVLAADYLVAPPCTTVQPDFILGYIHLEWVL